MPDLLENVHVLAHLLCPEHEIFLPSFLSDPGYDIGYSRDDLRINVVSWIECVNRVVKMANSQVYFHFHRLVSINENGSVVDLVINVANDCTLIHVLHHRLLLCIVKYFVVAEEVH